MVSNPDKHPPKAVNYNVACIIHDGQSAQLLPPPPLLSRELSRQLSDQGRELLRLASGGGGGDGGQEGRQQRRHHRRAEEKRRGRARAKERSAADRKKRSW